MPFIIVSLEGRGTAGGYLKIDGGRQIELSDDLMIQVSVGNHCLEFSSQSSAERGIANLNVAVGNYRTAAYAERNAVDGIITEYFPELSVMRLTVMSDSRGHILDMPRFSMLELSEEDYQGLDELYEERLEAAAATEKRTIGIELLLCLFLGGLGAHKFYRHQYGMGALYLVTFGLFGIGLLVDLVKLLIAYVRACVRAHVRSKK